MSWDARDGGYTAEELRAVFSAHGPVSDVVMRQPKKKKKSTSSAFVEMGTLEAAAAAARAANGRSDLPLLVVPFSKVGMRSHHFACLLTVVYRRPCAAFYQIHMLPPIRHGQFHRLLPRGRICSPAVRRIK